MNPNHPNHRTRTLACLTLAASALTLTAGCNLGLRTDPGILIDLTATTASLDTTLVDYHRYLADHLDDRTGNTIRDFTQRVVQAAADQAVTGGHVATFTSDMDRLQRERLDEQDRFHNALDQTQHIRTQALRAHRLASRSAGLTGLIRHVVDLLLNKVGLTGQDETPDDDLEPDISF